jgi:magnesium chelatase subunit D
MAAALALPHRRRRNPFDPPGLEQEKLDQALAAAGLTAPDPEPDGDPDPDPRPPDGPSGSADGPAPTGEPKEESGTGTRDVSHEAVPVEAGAPFRARLLTVPGTGLGASGRRSPALTPDGRTIRSAAPDRAWRGRPHLVGTIYAAAPHQHRRGRSGPGLVMRPADVRAPVRHGKEGNLIAFCVDASGSMAARQRMREVKTAVLSLLLDAYQRRDKVGLVTFRGRGAELALPPTSSVDIAATRLSALATGGRTPLAEGLHRVGDLLRVEAVRDPRRRPLVVVVTDGRATAGADAVPRAMWAARILGRMANTVVVDCESGRLRLGVAAELASEMGAEYLPLGEVAAQALTAAVRVHTMPDRGSDRRRSA